MRNMRRGFVYVAVLILAVVGLIGGVAYHAMMQAGRRQAYRSLAGEYAAMMARGGLAIAQGYLARTSRDPGSPVYKALVKPLSEYSGDAPVELGGTVSLKDELPKLTDALARDLPDGPSGLSRLDATFYLVPSDLRPLPALPLTPDRKLERGGVEKCGHLFVEVTAVIGRELFTRGADRTVRASQEFRVLHAPVPVLSQFTLWLSEVPAPGGADDGSAVNKLDATDKGQAQAGVPVVLSHGDVEKQSEMAAKMDRDLFRNQGWVFLGGANVALNLTYSQEETSGDAMVGEDFQFYQVNRQRPDAGRTVSDPSRRTQANAHLGGGDFWELRNWDMGVNRMKAGELATEYADLFDGETDGHRLGSLLKLFGAAPDRISPSVVFGDVSAGLLRLVVAAASRNPSGTFDAYYAALAHRSKSASGFLQPMWSHLASMAGRVLYNDDPKLSAKWAFMKPDITDPLLPLASGATEDDYKALCSGYRTRPYNEGLLHMKANNESADPRSKSTELGLPDVLFAESADRSKLVAELLPPELATLAGMDLAQLDLAKLADPLAHAACLRVPAGVAVEKWLADEGMLNGGELDLGTAVVSDGTLTLPAVTAIKRGGLILAKEIKLTGPVSAGLSAGAAPDPRRRLVLVSAKAGIALPGGPVEASLVSLGGIATPPGAFQVRGNLVAPQFDFGPLGTGTGTAKLDYDRSLKERAADAAADGSLLVDWQRRWVRLD